MTDVTYDAVVHADALTAINETGAILHAKRVVAQSPTAAFNAGGGMFVGVKSAEHLAERYNHRVAAEVCVKSPQRLIRVSFIGIGDNLRGTILHEPDLAPLGFDFSSRHLKFGDFSRHTLMSTTAVTTARLKLKDTHRNTQTIAVWTTGDATAHEAYAGSVGKTLTSSVIDAVPTPDITAAIDANAQLSEEDEERAQHDRDAAEYYAEDREAEDRDDTEQTWFEHDTTYDGPYDYTIDPYYWHLVDIGFLEIKADNENHDEYEARCARKISAHQELQLAANGN